MIAHEASDPLNTVHTVHLTIYTCQLFWYGLFRLRFGLVMRRRISILDLHSHSIIFLTSIFVYINIIHRYTNWEKATMTAICRGIVGGIEWSIGKHTYIHRILQSLPTLLFSNHFPCHSWNICFCYLYSNLNIVHKGNKKIKSAE